MKIAKAMRKVAKAMVCISSRIAAAGKHHDEMAADMLSAAYILNHWARDMDHIRSKRSRSTSKVR